jgi:hypothetical protein
VPPDFLNSREDAAMVWVVIILGYAVYKDPRGIGGAFLNVLRALFQPKLLLLFGCVMLYSAALVYGAERVGLWQTDTIKETTYWFFGTGVILVGEAVSRGELRLRRVLRRIVAATILIEFAANLYAFPLGVELMLVLLAFVFVAMQAYAPHDDSVTPATRRFIDGVLIALGITYLAYFLVRALSDLDGFLTRHNAEALLNGPVLTVALVPALYVFAWLSRREQENLRRRWQAGFNSPA